MTILLFDLFGVIARHQSESGRTGIERAVELSGAKVDADRFWKAYWSLRPAYDRGKQSSAEYWRAVFAALGASLDPERLYDLVTADVASWSVVDHGMVQLLHELIADGVQLGLLSNLPKVLAAHYERTQPWLDVFAVRAFSCRIGHAKPEPEAYRACLAALGVPASEVWFIDDRAENIIAAEALGMRGHLFVSQEGLRAALKVTGGV